MKKSDWIITIGTFAYSYLFYHQLAGINFLVFSVLLCALLAMLHPDKRKDRKWLLYAGFSVITSFFIVWHTSDLAVFANISSLLLLSANSVNSSSSVLISGFFSLYSILGSYVFMILALVNGNEKKTEEPAKNGKRAMNLLIWLGVIVIVLIFFFIYKSANPLFEKFTEKINLDFISWGWILFTILGFFVVYGLLKNQRIPGIDAWESQLPVTLTNEGKKIKSFERPAGIFLFVILNIMLLSINALDVAYLYVLKQLPEGITHTQFVHNGVGMIILSIVMGIALILILFRNAMNFEERNKLVKFLVTLWILQNAMMIFSTGVRNYIYVSEFNLTYKRIGVFVYLSLSIIGLFLTLYKIQQRKSNWFLIRSNAFCFYLFLCFSCFVNWDKLICEFNISHKSGKLHQLDKQYLLGLSNEVIPYLQSLKAKPGFEIDSVNADYENRLRSVADYFSEKTMTTHNSSETDTKTYDFLKWQNEHTSWQSWNYRNANILNQLALQNKSGVIKTLTLYNQELDSVGLLNIFNNAEEVDLTYCKGNKFAFLGAYKKIRTLTVSSCGINSLATLPKIPVLKSLIIDHNTISDLNGLSHFPALESLDASFCNFYDLRQMPVNRSLRSINLDGCSYLKNLRGLNNAAALETLSFNTAPNLDYFPSLPSLKKLQMSNCDTKINNNLQTMPVLENLEELFISNNSDLLLDKLIIYNNRTKDFYPRFPKLKKLYAYSSTISNTDALNRYKELEVLQLNNNKLYSTSFLANMPKIKELSLASNSFSMLELNERHAGLEKLNLNNDALIADFSCLKHLNNLHYLDISSTHFENLEALNCMNSLQELNISSTRIRSLDVLVRFNKLKALHISELSDKDITVLKRIPSLKELYITPGNYTPQELSELKKQLPALTIYEK